MAKARIPVPGVNDPLGVLELLGKVNAGITAAGANSLLVGELKTELQAVGSRVAAALAAHQEAKTLERRIEKLYEQRDAVVTEGVPLLQRGSKSLQGALGPARLHEMGDYGYTVNDSPPAPAA